MKRIGVLSDTHGNLPDGGFIEFFKECDEIWHAGDIGNIHVIDTLETIKPVRAVYGNIDGTELRKKYPKHQAFDCEEVHVLITHIGGRPGKYDSSAQKLINHQSPGLFICGHSHILKIQYDKTRDFLFVNPGAAGRSGFHKVRTAVRFQIEGSEIKNMEIFEKDRKSKAK